MDNLHGKLNPWNAKDLERVHQASLSILEKTGVQVDYDHALDFLEATDAKVDRDSKTVRFPGSMVQERLDNAPGSWDRRRAGAGTFSVSADCGGRFAWDYNSKRPRAAGPRDLVDAPRLVQAMDNIDEAGNLIFAQGIPEQLLDLITYRHMWNYTEKKGGGGLGRCPSCVNQVLPKSLDYLCDMLAVKIGKEKMQSDPEFSFFMGAASPLRWGRDILAMTIHAIKRGQVVGIGGNVVCGIQSPITAAANIAIDHAERLSGLCIVTSIKPEAKFYFCNHTYFLDMSSGDIASGSPEQTLLALLGEKLLEQLGFKLVVNHPVCDVGAHSPDAQAAAEKAMYMLLTALGGAKGIGGAGQLKEIFSYEQLVIDNEIAGYVKHLIKGSEINKETLALDEINRFGIGGNFLTSETTMQFLRQAYHRPQVFYRKRMSEWLSEGAKDALERGHEKVEEILRSEESPRFLTDEQLAAMDEIIQKACREFAPEWDPTAYLRCDI